MLPLIVALGLIMAIIYVRAAMKTQPARPRTRPAQPAVTSPLQDDLVATLVALGYRRADALKAVTSANIDPDKPFDAALREVLNSTRR